MSDVTDLKAEVLLLRQENAKLRKKADMLQWNSDCFIKIYGAWKRLRATAPHLEAENAKLRVENERLTETLQGAEREADRLTHEAAELSIENAKLRELLSDYSDCLDTALWLAADAGYPVMPARDKFLSLEKRKREMGIEVD